MRSPRGGRPAHVSTAHLLLDANQYVRCVITNLSANEIVGDKIEAVDSLGNVSLLVNPFTRAPGATFGNTFFVTSGR